MKYFLLFFLTISFYNLVKSETDIAQITSRIAVIYKDSRLKVPLGYMREGKKLRVGKNYKTSSKIYPILVEKKIAFIHTKDIRILSENEQLVRKVREHNTEFSDLEAIHRNTKNSSATLSYSSGGTGSNWKQLSEFMGDKNIGSLKTFSLLLIHHPKKSTFYLGAGLTKISIDQRSVSLNSLLGNVSLYMNLYKEHNIQIMLNTTVLFSGDIQIDSAYSKTPSRGLAIGGQLGISTRFFPESKIGTILGLYTQKIKTSELGPIENESGELYQLDEISGYSLYAGLTYHF